MKKLPKKGDRVMILKEDGMIKLGTIRIRAINCGKPGCTKCPHKSYMYAQYRDKGKVKQRYIGVVKKLRRSFKKRG